MVAVAGWVTVTVTVVGWPLTVTTEVVTRDVVTVVAGGAGAGGLARRAAIMATIITTTTMPTTRLVRIELIYRMTY